jgi:hypothetical protein
MYVHRAWLMMEMSARTISLATSFRLHWLSSMRISFINKEKADDAL